MALAAVQLSAIAVTALVPGADSEVLEVLPAVTRLRPARSSAAPLQAASPAAAVQQARQDIAVARQTGDTRYWGRAQAALAPWWDRPDAPPDLAVLQATVQQGRHEFEPSRKVLTATLARAPAHAQGWLNLAALERLSGRYVESLRACDAVARAGQALYAQACRFETESLQGRSELARQGLQNLLTQSSNDDQRSWLLSLLAESEERAGRDRAAASAYARSLALGPDLYTAIAYSDLLLRTGKTRQAIEILAPLPETDAVLLRRGAALRRLKDAHWLELRATLRERGAELDRRGDDRTLHARELALISLWLDDDAPAAWKMAQRNLQLQREPVDWWVALESARLAGDASAVAGLRKGIADVGLVDARLTEPSAKVAR